MSHTYFQNVMHIVFSTKERRKMIPAHMKKRLWSYAAGICKHEKIFVHAIGGMEDHMHLLLQFPATVVIANAIMKIKANSSGWMSEESGAFSWQEGYGGFSVSKSNIAAVVRYIQNQEQRHRRMTFEDEFIALLEKHGVEIRSEICIRLMCVTNALSARRGETFFVPRLRARHYLYALPALTDWANLSTRLRRRLLVVPA